MPYFFARREGDRAIVEGGDARHLARSLRARPGETIEVVDPAGFILTVELKTVGDSRVEGLILAEREHRPEPERNIVVAIAHLPAASLELVLTRCTEVGAAAFHVVQAERSVARGARTERWETIVREAAMLAGRLTVPGVSGPTPLHEAVATRPNPVMLTRDAAEPLLGKQLPNEVTLLVGPEGGWTERELGMVSEHASLGPRNLRADTAAIVATAIAAGL